MKHTPLDTAVLNHDLRLWAYEYADALRIARPLESAPDFIDYRRYANLYVNEPRRPIIAIESPKPTLLRVMFEIAVTAEGHSGWIVATTDTVRIPVPAADLSAENNRGTLLYDRVTALLREHSPANQDR